MAAPTTIQDLPDDMLHEIFGRVFADEPKKPDEFFHVQLPPVGAHAALRCVCRRWRDIADWERLSTSKISIETSELADASALRARHPAAFKRISLIGLPDRHSSIVSLAAASLINGSADLRRAVAMLQLQTCCLPALLPAVAPIASCTALTELCVFWKAHEKKGRAVPSNMFAPLSALRTLETLVLGHIPFGKALPASALLAPLPALPDVPRLTFLVLHMSGNFVPVGSDAALGRLRKLELEHLAPVQELVDAEDPFLMRAAFDAGTWQPSRLTGLKDLLLTFNPVRDSRAPLRPSPTGSPAGSEWAPLAGQVTSLWVKVKSDGYKRPSTGIVAGLGALTALRLLDIEANVNSLRAGWLELASIDRVRTPHLTHLSFNCAPALVNVSRFPNLGSLALVSLASQPPLNLRSLVTRSSLKMLQLCSGFLDMPSVINLAELFVGGAGWPVLEELYFRNIVLEWDTTGLAGAPTAAEFAQRERKLLPALVKVGIEVPSGRGALPDRSRVEFVVACRRHVLPALLWLRAGGIEE